ncbi:MAG: methenyltetrahydromethanopterin cyclohydrolase [Gemmatimonadales bacterium]|jgi:methenyltetrahydromethanopterin cyclohydrolase|nr:methenyltetrahydromethanopterin cyclohydrolase [Gemmatimonadales bacterium]
MDKQVTSLRMNEAAAEIADSMADQADLLRVKSFRLPSGARVIDAGVEAQGGIEAGLALAEICMGGLGNVSFAPLQIGGRSHAGLIVWTDHPAVACMASQYAGWAISVGKFFAMGSGPLRAHARVERELFDKLGYEEQADEGVLVLETRSLPTDEVAAWVAEKARLQPLQLTFVVAPTASIAGGVQISARIVETGLHKMETLGFDVTRVVSAMGTAPLPPVAKNDLRAIGRTNDCILYGGQARYTIKAADAELEQLAEQVPASASRDYGTPFYEIFQRYGGDFYKIDPLLFSPAEVWLTSTESGRTFHAGRLNPEVLEASLYT